VPATRKSAPTGVCKSGGVGAQEERRRFYVTDATETAKRNAATQALFDLFRNQSRHAFRVFYGAGRDGIDSNAVTAPLDGQVARQGVNTGLRSRNVQLIGRARIVQSRADVED
jgi:hypothetical protein